MTARCCLAAGIAALLAVATSLAPDAASAEPTVIYRCTAPDGTLTFQNGTACPPGHQQQRRVIDIAAPLPAFVAPPAPPERAPQVPLISTLPVAPVMADADVASDTEARTAPPDLFACRVYDNSTYWREDDAPPARCRPLQTVGIGGLPGMGAGQACERIDDVCERVPADDLCRAWDSRVREAEFRWQFGDAQAREAAGLEYERLFNTLQASSCMPPTG